MIEEDLTYRVIGLMYEVHNKLGELYQEKHYQRALEKVLSREKISFEREKSVDILIDGEKIGTYRLDFFIGGKLIVELKTVDVFSKKYQYQILRYMNQLQVQVGLLANFRKPKVQIKRIVLPEKYRSRSV